MLSLIGAWPIAALAAPYVYVVNAGEWTVSVMDAATDTVTNTIPVGTAILRWPTNPVVNPTGTRVYLAVQNAVVVVDATTNTVIKGITEGVQPAGGLALDPTGTHLYVVNYTDPGTVSVIDTTSLTVTATISGRGRLPTHMVVSPDGTRGYVVNTFDDNEMYHCRSFPDQCPLTVDVLDLTRNAWLTTVPRVGGNLGGIAVDPMGKGSTSRSRARRFSATRNSAGWRLSTPL